MLNKLRLINERRSVTYAIILGVWLIVALYAILHDQYIVRIAPEHFTVYHRPLWNIQTAEGLAAAHAFRASLWPGVLLGIACLFVGRSGRPPRISIRFILVGTVLVIIATEILAAASGLWVYLNEMPLYPRDWYPYDSLEIMTTQTIQLSCYFLASLFSAVLLATMTCRRVSARRKARAAVPAGRTLST